LKYGIKNKNKNKIFSFRLLTIYLGNILYDWTYVPYGQYENQHGKTSIGYFMVYSVVYADHGHTQINKLYIIISIFIKR